MWPGGGLMTPGEVQRSTVADGVEIRRHGGITLPPLRHLSRVFLPVPSSFFLLHAPNSFSQLPTSHFPLSTLSIGLSQCHPIMEIISISHLFRTSQDGERRKQRRAPARRDRDTCMQNMPRYDGI